MLIEVTVRIEIDDEFVDDICKDGLCKTKKKQLMSDFTATSVKYWLVKECEDNPDMNIVGVDVHTGRLYEAIDRFVQVVLVEKPQKADKFIVQVWDGEKWSTVQEIVTVVSNPEWHRRARVTADNTVLKIQKMALHFAISEMKE